MEKYREFVRVTQGWVKDDKQSLKDEERTMRSLKKEFDEVWTAAMDAAYKADKKECTAVEHGHELDDDITREALKS